MHLLWKARTYLTQVHQFFIGYLTNTFSYELHVFFVSMLGVHTTPNLILAYSWNSIKKKNEFLPKPKPLRTQKMNERNESSHSLRKSNPNIDLEIKVNEISRKLNNPSFDWKESSNGLREVIFNPKIESFGLNNDRKIIQEYMDRSYINLDTCWNKVQKYLIKTLLPKSPQAS